MNEYHGEAGRHEVGGPVIPPGSTPVRMLCQAVADALSLPPPRAIHDEQLRYAVLGQRAMIIAQVTRRLAGDVEADAMDIAVAASSIRDRCADFPVNYSVHPLTS
jgi:hypothetical protein